MRHRASRVGGLHPESHVMVAMVAFTLATDGDVERIEARYRQITRLPRIVWKGRQLYTIQCHGTRGKGPHTAHVPLSLVWALIDLRAFRCPYHAGD